MYKSRISVKINEQNLWAGYFESTVEFLDYKPKV